MSKVLYIKANPKSDEKSNTFRLADVFIEAYQQNNPDDEIITLDLYKEGIKPLDEQMVTAIYSGTDKEVKAQAQRFADCDKYIFAAPMWNLSIPAMLKCYFDYVSYAGVTFKYTEHGPVGLLAGQNKKAVHIVSRGGMYSSGPGQDFELGDKYIRTILGFLGVHDVQTLAFEQANMLQGADLEQARAEMNDRARELAKHF